MSILCCICELPGTIVYYIGLLVTIRLLVSAGYMINRYKFRKQRDLQAVYGKNTWVFVTGAYGGIGIEICKHAAKNGFNVVLSGRNKDKLDAAEAEVNKLYGKVETRTVIFDLSISTDYSHFENMVKHVEDIDISIFINNAAVMTYLAFEDLSVEEIKTMIDTNITALTYLNKVFTKRLSARSTKSAIVNVASLAGFYQFPLCQVYAATKAYVRSFSLGAAKEFDGKIDIYTHSPGFTRTNLNSQKTGMEVAEPSECAESIFRDVGLDRETQPNMSHEIQINISAFLHWISLPLYELATFKAGESEIARMSESKKSL